jgi:hypothetical protein
MTTISLSVRNSEVLAMIDGEAPIERERAAALDSQTSDLLDALAERNIHSRRDLLAALAECHARIREEIIWLRLPEPSDDAKPDWYWDGWHAALDALDLALGEETKP